MSERALPVLNRTARWRLVLRTLPLSLVVALAATEARAQTEAEPEKPPSESPSPKAKPAPAPEAAPAPAAPDAAPIVVETADKNKAAPKTEKQELPPAIAPAAKAASTPAAPKEGPESAPDDGAMGSHRDHWLGSVGVRVGYIPNEGFDPFDTNNGLTQFSLGIGRTLYGEGDLAFAALLLWDGGGSEATARGGKAELYAHRLSVGGEGRYHIFRRFYLFGRVAPGAIRWDASLEDSSVGYTRDAGNWMFALDLSAGANFEFAGEARGASNRPRGWLSVEGGYGWSTASEVIFEGGEDDQVPARVEPLVFDDLALRGGFFRIAANITY
jgi:hypothetical protein